jgi:hypothetical protein
VQTEAAAARSARSWSRRLESRRRHHGIHRGQRRCAAAKRRRIDAIDRRRVRTVFEERFSATAVASEYVAVYWCQLGLSAPVDALDKTGRPPRNDSAKPARKPQAEDAISPRDFAA